MKLSHSDDASNAGVGIETEGPYDHKPYRVYAAVVSHDRVTFRSSWKASRLEAWRDVVHAMLTAFFRVSDRCRGYEATLANVQRELQQATETLIELKKLDGPPPDEVLASEVRMRHDLQDEIDKLDAWRRQDKKDLAALSQRAEAANRDLVAANLKIGAMKVTLQHLGAQHEAVQAEYDKLLEQQAAIKQILKEQAK